MTLFQLSLVVSLYYGRGLVPSSNYPGGLVCKSALILIIFAGRSVCLFDYYGLLPWFGCCLFDKLISSLLQLYLVVC